MDSKIELLNVCLRTSCFGSCSLLGCFTFVLVYKSRRVFTIMCGPCIQQHRPRGPMDKASAYGAGDCRFESCRGHFIFAAGKRIAHEYLQTHQQRRPLYRGGPAYLGCHYTGGTGQADASKHSTEHSIAAHIRSSGHARIRTRGTIS